MWCLANSVCLNSNKTQINFKPYIFKSGDKWTNNKQIPNNSNYSKVSSQCRLISYISMLGNFGVFPILRSWKLALLWTPFQVQLCAKFWTLFHISQERLDSLGHFRVPNLPAPPLKMRPYAKPFLWKCVLFAWEWQIIFISEAPGNSEMTYSIKIS